MPESTDDSTDDSIDNSADTSTDESSHNSTDDTPGEGATTDLPRDVAEEAARLTRLALDATDRVAVDGPFEEALDDADAEAVQEEASLYRERRDTFLDRFDYVPRVREDRDGGATLVCYPADWLDEEGTVRIDADLDTSRAVEISLSGPGEQGDFEEAAKANDALVDAIREAHGDLHAENVRSFADFMGNHYARPATTASASEVREFLEHYYPRNAWPTEAQAGFIEESLRYAFEHREKSYPLD